MSVAPFLPGLLAPPPDAGTAAGTASGASTDAQPGAAEGETAFMDALAAALAVLPGLAPAPTPAASTSPASPTSPASTAAAAPGLSGLGNAELGFVTAELGVSTAELGFVTPELGLGTADLGLGDSAAKAPAVETAATTPAVTGGPVLDAALPSSDHPAPPRTDAATAHGDAPGLALPDGVLAGRSPTATPGPDLSVTTPDSTVVSPDSAVTNPNSRVENPNSAVTSPKSVERAVATQVFPEVTRLASSGNGTHRITLTLQPAQLGEVRVTLVVRDGAVRVRMSGEAGDGAVRQALASGAPELQRMLERAGATEARVLVRDPFNPAAMPSTPVAAGRQDATGSWTGSDQFQQAEQFNPSSESGQSRGEGRDEGSDGRSGHQPGHPNESAGRRAAAAGVVPPSTPTAGRLDRNL